MFAKFWVRLLQGCALYTGIQPCTATTKHAMLPGWISVFPMYCERHCSEDHCSEFACLTKKFMHSQLLNCYLIMNKPSRTADTCADDHESTISPMELQESINVYSACYPVQHRLQRPKITTLWTTRPWFALTRQLMTL